VSGGHPIRAFLELRARLLVRRFLSRRGVPELLARVVVFAMSGLTAVLFAGLTGAGTWRAARIGRGLEAEIGATSVFFGVWLTWTAIALTLAERDTLDLRRFLVYPLPPGRVYAYGLFSSAAADPFALFWTVMLGGGFLGAAAGRPGGWLVPLAATFLLFIVATVVYVALLQELFGRLVRIRRAREVAIAGAYLLLVLLVAYVSTGGRRPLGELLRTLSRLQWIAWPAALASAAARKLFGGQGEGAVLPLIGLALGGAATGWAAFRLALSDALSGEEGARMTGRPSAQSRGLPVGWLGPARAPLVEKELQYLARHPLALVMALVIPAIAALVAWRAVPGLVRYLESQQLSAEATDLMLALPLFAFALYAHVVTQPFWLNGFGWDRGGARLLFLAPIDLTDVLAAKNLSVAVLSFGIFAGCTLAIAGVGGWPPAWVIVGGFALHAGLSPWLYAVGNFVTVANPIGAGFTLERGSRLPMLSGLVGMFATSAMAGIFALPVLVAVKLEDGWLLPPAWAALGLVGMAIHRVTLPTAGGIARRRCEGILDAVCGEEE
jgi:ABC-2 type transport system permease protein